MPSSTASLRFSAGLLRDAPALARHALRAWLATLDCDGVGSDALLVISELTTNAVVHARSSAAIVASLDDGRLRIELHDDDPTRPQMSDIPGAEGGWGLRIVDAIADGWAGRPRRQASTCGASNSAETHRCARADRS